LHNPVGGSLQVWDLENGDETSGILDHPDSDLEAYPSRLMKGWTMIDWGPEGRFLATASINGTACLWDTSRAELATEPWVFGGRPAAVCFLRDFPRLVIGGARWGTALENYVPELHCIALNAPEFPKASFASGSGVHAALPLTESRVITNQFGELVLWDIVAQERTARRGGGAEDIAWSPPAGVVAVGSRDGTAWIISSETLQDVVPPLAHGAGGVRGVGFSRDGSLVATGGLEGSVQIWSLDDPPARIGTWPQRAVIDQLVTKRNGGDVFVTKSRSRDRSQAAVGIVRRFPGPICRQVGSLPDGSVLLDACADGEPILVRSADATSLLICDRQGKMFTVGPDIEKGSGIKITGASFSEGTDQIVFSMGHPDHAQHYRIWDLASAKQTDFAFSYSYGGNSALAILPSHPPLLLARKDGWQVDLVDLQTEKLHSFIGLSNRPSAFTIAGKRDWFAVGDLSGKLRRFNLENHEEIFPSIELERPLSGAACSGDNEWLVTIERADDGRNLLRAWYLDESSAFLNIKIPTQREVEQLFAVGNRGFVFQSGNELRRFDLPEVAHAPAETGSLTEVALALRKDGKGQLHVLDRRGFLRAAQARRPGERDAAEATTAATSEAAPQRRPENTEPAVRSAIREGLEGRSGQPDDHE
jgi:WD40 repeat protein